MFRYTFSRLKPNKRFWYAIWLFQRRLILPNLLASISITTILIASGDISYLVIGHCLIIGGLIIHLLIYEVQNPGEYYFYFNLGISKEMLWTSTVGLNFIIASLLYFV